MQSSVSSLAAWMVLELLLIGIVVVTQLPSGAGTEFNEELKNLSDVALRDVCVENIYNRDVEEGPDNGVQTQCDSENTVIHFHAGNYAEGYSITFVFVCTSGMNGTELQEYTSGVRTISLQYNQEKRYDIDMPPLAPRSQCLLSGCYVEDFYNLLYRFDDAYCTFPVPTPTIAETSTTSISSFTTRATSAMYYHSPVPVRTSTYPSFTLLQDSNLSPTSTPTIPVPIVRSLGDSSTLQFSSTFTTVTVTPSSSNTNGTGIVVLLPTITAAWAIVIISLLIAAFVSILITIRRRPHMCRYQESHLPTTQVHERSNLDESVTVHVQNHAPSLGPFTSITDETASSEHLDDDNYIIQHSESAWVKSDGKEGEDQKQTCTHSFLQCRDERSPDGSYT